VRGKKSSGRGGGNQHTAVDIRKEVTFSEGFEKKNPQSRLREKLEKERGGDIDMSPRLLDGGGDPRGFEGKGRVP